MLPNSAGVEPATSWSPVGRRIQLSHRGRQKIVRHFVQIVSLVCMKFQSLFSWKKHEKYFKMSSAEIFTQDAKRARQEVKD